MGDRTFRLLAALFVLVGAAVRMHGLGTEGFSGDEVARITAVDQRLPFASGPPRVPIMRPRRPIPIPPLPAAITRLTTWWGYEEASMRLPVVLGGMLTVLMVWLVVDRLLGAEVALYAAALMALSPLHVAASRTVAPYVWVAAFGSATALALTAAIRSSVGWVWVFAPLAFATGMSGYTGFLIILAVVLSLLVARGTLPSALVWRLCLVGLAAVAVAVGWAVFQPFSEPRSLLRIQLSWALLPQIASSLADGTPEMSLAAMGLLACAVLGVVLPSAGKFRRAFFAWAFLGIAGTILLDRAYSARFEPAHLVGALPGYLVVAALGIHGLRRLVAETHRLGRTVAQLAGMISAAALLLPHCLDDARTEKGPSWREAAAIVRDNAGKDDVIVVLEDRQSFVFYAPELEHRVAVQVIPSLAASYFVGHKRGWLIAPATARQYRGWAKISSWFESFPPVDLGPGEDISVYYMGEGDREALLIEAAFFELPATTLARGKLLFEMVRTVGPIPPVLWKLDQVVLSRDDLRLRNPDLLNVVYYLADQAHGDRAGSLAYRLATRNPTWVEARQALDAFRAQPSSKDANGR